MAQARYTVLIPATPGLDQAVYQYLTDGPIHARAVNMQPGVPYTTVTAWADENPETDSHFKQVGTYIGEVANTPTISVIRENKSGAHTWEMRNQHYVPKSIHDDLTNQTDQAESGQEIHEHHDSPSVPSVMTESPGVVPGEGSNGVEEQMLDEGSNLEPVGTQSE